MAYTLKRPMFRKGGLSQETGIMSGLDRRGYAGGGNIGGGRISGTPMGSRTGFQDNRWERYGRNLRNWYSNLGKPTNAPYTGTRLPVPYSKPPLLSERGLLEAAKKIGTKGAGIMSAATQRFPAISKLVSSPWVSIPGAAISQYQMTKPEEYEKEYGISQIEKALLSNLPGTQLYRQSLAKMAADEKKDGIDTKAGPFDYLQSKKDKDLIDTVEDDRATDLRTVYEDLLPLFKEELAADPESTAKEKYIALAKFGTSLLGQPGGDLAGAVGRAAEKPLEDVGKIISEKSKTDREAKLLALQSAMRETELGPIGKSVKDLIKLGYSKEAATKKVVEQGTGSATREATQAGIVKDLQLIMQEDFGIKKGSASRSAAQKMLESEKAGVLAYEYTKLPKDKEERDPGKYYVSKEGRIGRYHKGKLIPPGEPGFTGEMV